MVVGDQEGQAFPGHRVLRIQYVTVPTVVHPVKAPPGAGPDTRPMLRRARLIAAHNFIRLWTLVELRAVGLTSYTEEDGTFVGARHYWGANQWLWQQRPATVVSSRRRKSVASFSRRPSVRSSNGTTSYLYATLAPFFAALFFPPGNETAALLSALCPYAAGFLVRPFGALVFGRLAIWSAANTPSWSPSFSWRLDVRRRPAATSRRRSWLPC